MVSKILGAIGAGLLALIVFAFITSIFVMWLWNFVVPDVFGLPAISWIQALAMTVLFQFLFKGTGGSG